jgi:hypothetical protein
VIYATCLILSSFFDLGLLEEKCPKCFTDTKIPKDCDDDDLE